MVKKKKFEGNKVKKRVPKNMRKPIFSEEFVEAIQSSVDEWLELDDFGDNCVTALDLRDEKDFDCFVERDGSEIHPQRMRLLIMSCVSTGQVDGLDIRRGIGGGVHRIHARSVKPVVADETAVNETTTGVSCVGAVAS